MLYVSIILALSIPLVLIIGYYNRKGSDDQKTKGIGWQFIRYNVLCISLPLVGLLAINGVLTGEVATVIAGIVGFAFGKTSD